MLGQGWNYRMRKIPAILCISAFLAVGCQQEKQAPPQMPPMTVEVANVEQRDVPIYSEWIGTMDGSVNAEIKPQVEGYLLQQLYTAGSFVKKGQILFKLDPRQAKASLEQAQGNLMQAQAVLANSEMDVKRYQPLAAQKAISQQELDNAIASQRAAKANVDAMQAAVDMAKLKVGWTNVVSPIDGIIGIAKPGIGDLITPSTVMTTVSTVNPIFVDFSVSEQEYLKYARSNFGKADRKEVLELYLADGSKYQRKGDALLLNRQVDPTTGTLMIRGSFANPNSLLRPGAYARIRALTDLRPKAIVVPQKAVSELQGIYQIAVVGADSKVSIRNVKVGPQVGELWVIDSGVSPGDKVVVEGLQKIREGAVVNAVPAKAHAQGAAGSTGD